ncbi:cell division initiation protein [Microbacterium koreense]|uniref:Cell division initiation protein n=1 Tax=Microbacterium koreense TaxID=323761 RepID=A0ABW2ZMA6_9MICO
MSDPQTPFDELMAASASSTPSAETVFPTVFRGYDKEIVDDAIAALTSRVRQQADAIADLDERATQAYEAHADLLATVQRLEEESEAAKVRAKDAEDRAATAVDDALAESRATIERLESDLTAAQAKATDAENRIEGLAEELVAANDDTPGRNKFEEILRVAEEQANVLLRNASTQGERLLAAAQEEIETKRKDAKADAEAIISEAQHDAQQIRLRIDTELTAHEARIEREATHADEKVAQAEQEAATIRSEAEKGAAALRALVARETTQMRAEAEEAVRELRMRALEFEESLTRRQDDAQQEFLALHNQAVAHADRITQDANDQVANSLEHAKRVSLKAEDFERLMRAQAAQIEADANLRAREKLDRARDKAQSIIDTVVTHSQAVLRDAEDRTRQLRWQQQQLTSFMSEVKELIRPEGLAEPTQPAPDETDQTDASDEAQADPSEGDVVEVETAVEIDESSDGDAADEESDGDDEGSGV